MAHGVEQSTVINAAFEQIHLPLPFEFEMVEMFPTDVEHIHQSRVISPLVFHVVDRQKRSRMAKERIVAIDRIEEDGNCRRMPIVAMDDIGRKIELFAKLKSRSR